MNKKIEKKLDKLMEKKEDLIWELVDIQMKIAELFEKEAEADKNIK